MGPSHTRAVSRAYHSSERLLLRRASRDSAPDAGVATFPCPRSPIIECPQAQQVGRFTFFAFLEPWRTTESPCAVAPTYI